MKENTDFPGVSLYNTINTETKIKTNHLKQSIANILNLRELDSMVSLQKATMYGHIKNAY